MSKRQHRASGNNRPSTQDNDKPDYAADYPVRKAKTPKQPEENQAHLKEHLQGNVLQDLNRLKTSLQKEQEAEPSKKSGQSKASSKFGHGSKQRSGSSNQKKDDVIDENKSFAELFEPQEEDDSSFEDLLKESKLDWRRFK